jgi:uncharacterized membrane protein
MFGATLGFEHGGLPITGLSPCPNASPSSEHVGRTGQGTTKMAPCMERGTRSTGLNTSQSARMDYYARGVAHYVSIVMRWVSVHWLLVANAAMAVYIGLPLLAPVLMHAGDSSAADLIYRVFSPLCHQLPERSFFLYGKQPVYSLQELEQLLAGGVVPLRYNGAPGIGFKIAVCQRDVAIYLAMLIGGMFFAAVRNHLKSLGIRWFIVLAFPMAVDGTGQLIGLWTSTWLSRIVTGSLFGLACVWLAYPYLESGMKEVHHEMTKALTEWGQK